MRVKNDNQRVKEHLFFPKHPLVNIYNRARTPTRGNRAPAQGPTRFLKICLCVVLIKSRVARAEVRARNVFDIKFEFT